jgi:hypothetical protein
MKDKIFAWLYAFIFIMVVIVALYAYDHWGDTITIK